MGMDNYWFNAIYSLAPTVLVGGIFVVIMHAIIKADAHERKARAKVEAQERARLAKRLEAGDGEKSSS